MVSKKDSLLAQKKYKKPLAIIFILLGVVLFIQPIINQKPLIIPKENTQKTTGWKVYENSEYHFSFKYPEGLLSNFHVQTSSSTQQTQNTIETIKKSTVTANSNSYNVIFEADGWKFNGKLSEFINNNLSEPKGLQKQRLLLVKANGLRITNIDKKADVYFYYNIFQNGDFIYNFAIFADGPDLIRANTQLLEEIISTAKFN